MGRTQRELPCCSPHKSKFKDRIFCGHVDMKRNQPLKLADGWRIGILINKIKIEWIY